MDSESLKGKIQYPKGAYAELLKGKIEKHQSKVYLVNTGWIGGSAASGAKRISIQNTRSMITAILDGSIEQSQFRVEPVFNLACPLSLHGVDTKVLNPRSSWENVNEYDSQAIELAELFTQNFKTYGDAVSHLECGGPTSHEEVAI